MKRIITGLVVMMVLVFCAAFISQAATQEEAKANVEKAMAFWKANGKDKAIAEFNNPKGQFTKGDMYIHVQDFSGVMLANGGNPKLVGQNHLEVKDASGKTFVKEQIDTAKTKGSGWVNYMWTNPSTKKVQAKTAWVQKVDGENIFIGCGVWK
ncbi:MAG TPA: cache domain-containing protein [Syntrophorhabdaceae bacterium]|jgi:predicted RNase H-like HicB family nuclease